MTTQPPGRKPNQMIPQRATFMTMVLKSLKLKLRLMGDSRVSGWLKLGFLAGSIWVIFPDVIVGPLDDAVVLYFLSTWEDYCPPWVVAEHRQQMEREARGEPPKSNPGKPHSSNPGKPGHNNPGKPAEEEIVDAEWRDVTDDKDRTIHL